VIDPARLLRRVPANLGRVTLDHQGHTADALLTTESVEEDGGGPLPVVVQREVLTIPATFPRLPRKAEVRVDGSLRRVLWDRPIDGNPLLRSVALEHA
jgi:hypothetical protein